MRTISYSQIGHIAYPILISSLMEQLIGMTDTAFLGRVGEIELGASALGGVFYATVFMIGLGFSMGAQILMARRNGEGKVQQIGSIFYHSLVFLLLLALLLFGITRFCSPWILGHIIRSEEVFHAANAYLHWRVIGFFFAFVNLMFRAFYVATTHTRTLTLNSAVMVASNVLFNYLLIFGHCGLPALGIAGAAIGSSLAEGVSTLFYILHTRRHIPYQRYGLHILPRLHFHLLWRILGISVWTMVQNFLSLSTWFIFFVSVEHLGEHYLAATNILRSISAFTFMTVMAFASTACTLVGNLMGSRDADSVGNMLKRTNLLCFLILIPILLIIALFPMQFMSIFSADPVLLHTGHDALYVLLASYVFTVPAQIFLAAVSGTGNTHMALRFEFVSLFFYTIYVVVAIFMLRVSLSLCWASEFVYNFFSFILSWSYMRWGKWSTKQI